MNDQGNSRGWWCICWVSFSIMRLASSQGNIWCITVMRDQVLETECLHLSVDQKLSLKQEEDDDAPSAFSSVCLFFFFTNNRCPLAFSLTGLMGGGLEPVPAHGTPWTSLLLVTGLTCRDRHPLDFWSRRINFMKRSMFVQTKTQMMRLIAASLQGTHVQVSLLPDN